MNNSAMLSQPDEERKYTQEVNDQRKGSIFLNFDPKDLNVQDDQNQQIDFGADVGIGQINRRESVNRFDGDELLGIEQNDKPDVIPEEDEKLENSLIQAQNSSIDGGTPIKSNSGAGSLVGQNVQLMDDPFNGRTNLFKSQRVGRQTELN